MRNQHIGYRIKGFYKIASFSNKTEAMMATDAKQKLNALDMEQTRLKRNPRLCRGEPFHPIPLEKAL